MGQSANSNKELETMPNLLYSENSMGPPEKVQSLQNTERILLQPGKEPECLLSQS